ncbi:hypothetical protein TRVA0_009S00738 [Trichomonascus vanleenenianus]|uniref:uncharacterized protein n=1 Tax=Trichomonascus vanleenenianus TaxID=2268995 RepID=UPI003ECA4BDF
MIPVEILSIITKYCDVRTLLVIYKTIPQLKEIVSSVLFYEAAVLMNFADEFAIDLKTEVTTRYYTRYGEEVPYGVLKLEFDEVAPLLRVVKIDLGTHDRVPNEAWQFVGSLAEKAKLIEKIEYYGPVPIYKESFLFECIRNVRKEMNITLESESESETIFDIPAFNLYKVTKLSIDYGDSMGTKLESATVKKELKRILAIEPDYLHDLALSSTERKQEIDVADLCDVIGPLKSLTSVELGLTWLSNKSGRRIALPETLTTLGFVEDESLMRSPRPVFDHLKNLYAVIFDPVYIGSISFPRLECLDLLFMSNGVLPKVNIQKLFSQVPNLLCLRLSNFNYLSLASALSATGTLRNLHTLDLGSLFRQVKSEKLLSKIPDRGKITTLRLRGATIFTDREWPARCLQLFPNLKTLYIARPPLGKVDELYVKLLHGSEGFCAESLYKVNFDVVRERFPEFFR